MSENCIYYHYKFLEVDLQMSCFVQLIVLHSEIYTLQSHIKNRSIKTSCLTFLFYSNHTHTGYLKGWSGSNATQRYNPIRWCLTTYTHLSSWARNNWAVYWDVCIHPIHSVYRFCSYYDSLLLHFSLSSSYFLRSFSHWISFLSLYLLSKPSIFCLLSFQPSTSPLIKHTHWHTHIHTFYTLTLLQFHSGCAQVIKRQNGKQTVINLINNKKHLPHPQRNTQKEIHQPCHCFPFKNVIFGLWVCACLDYVHTTSWLN